MLRSLSLLSLLLFAPLAHASQFVNDEVASRAQILGESAASAPVAETPFKMIGELGTAFTRGNTETFHINGQVRLLLVPFEDWISETRARVLYEESRGETTANSFSVLQRVDRFVSPRFTIFGAFGWERNVFNGIDRRLSEQLGATFLAVNQKVSVPEELVRNLLRFELGAYAAQERYTLSPTAAPGTVLAKEGTDILAARGAVAFVHTFRKGSEFGVDVEAIQDFIDIDNLLVNSSIWTAAALTEGLALKLSASHFFDNVPAEASLKKSDFLVTAGIVVSI
jgi:hypothetical protein